MKRSFNTLCCDDDDAKAITTIPTTESAISLGGGGVAPPSLLLPGELWILIITAATDHDTIFAWLCLSRATTLFIRHCNVLEKTPLLRFYFANHYRAPHRKALELNGPRLVSIRPHTIKMSHKRYVDCATLLQLAPFLTTLDCRCCDWTRHPMAQMADSEEEGESPSDFDVDDGIGTPQAITLENVLGSLTNLRHLSLDDNDYFDVAAIYAALRPLTRLESLHCVDLCKDPHPRSVPFLEHATCLRSLCLYSTNGCVEPRHITHLTGLERVRLDCLQRDAADENESAAYWGHLTRLTSLREIYVDAPTDVATQKPILDTALLALVEASQKTATPITLIPHNDMPSFIPRKRRSIHGEYHWPAEEEEDDDDASESDASESHSFGDDEESIWSIYSSDEDDNDTINEDYSQ